MSGSFYFELLKGVPAAFVALIVGLIAPGIAHRQYHIARAKLKLDLFDKRYAIDRLVIRPGRVQSQDRPAAVLSDDNANQGLSVRGCDWREASQRRARRSSQEPGLAGPQGKAQRQSDTGRTR